MESCRSHALATRRTRNGTPSGCGPVFIIEHSHRSASAQDTPSQHVPVSAKEGIGLTSNSSAAATSFC